MIVEDYVSFETAKLLKEKGFSAEIHMYWGAYPARKTEGYIERCPKDLEVDNNCSLGFRPDDFECIAPTHQMAMKWLREVHNIFIAINVVPYVTVTVEQKYYFFKLYKDRRPYNPPLNDSVGLYPSCEEACEAAIKYCLENLI